MEYKRVKLPQFELTRKDADFYRIENRLAYLALVPSITVMGPLFPKRAKGRSKRGWTAPKVKV